MKGRQILNVAFYNGTYAKCIGSKVTAMYSGVSNRMILPSGRLALGGSANNGATPWFFSLTELAHWADLVS